MKILHYIAFILTVIGALNWGLVGIADFNVVKLLLGAYPQIERLVYILVGLSALWLTIGHITREYGVCVHK